MKRIFTRGSSLPGGLSDAHIPLPGSEWRAWTLAVVLGALGLGMLALVLTGAVGRVARGVPSAGPPAVLAGAPTPVPAAARTRGAPGQARLVALGEAAGVRVVTPAPGRSSSSQIVGQPSSVEQHRDLALYRVQTSTHILAGWMEGFYPIYSVAQSTFGVNWLLIASIHEQESAFSTAPSTYHGLNFAGCCGGPMQFNVTNRPVSTWQFVSDSYIYGQRPATYDHQTATHPSIYDDFDAIMAAAHLLSADGAGYALDDTAWIAAYDYYGHDPTGVTYADQVLARAIGWSQHGFCINCALEASLVAAVHGAYGR